MSSARDEFRQPLFNGRNLRPGAQLIKGFVKVSSTVDLRPGAQLIKGFVRVSSTVN